MTRSRTITLPPETFRIRPHPDEEDYFIVHIAPSLPAMRQAIKKHTLEYRGKLLAYCVSVSVVGGGDRHLVGVIFLSKSCMGSGIVAHELAHAAFRVMDHHKIKIRHWAKRTGRAGPFGYGSEERYAMALEHLTRNFWVEAFNRGLA